MNITRELKIFQIIIIILIIVVVIVAFVLDFKKNKKNIEGYFNPSTSTTTTTIPTTTTTTTTTPFIKLQNKIKSSDDLINTSRFALIDNQEKLDSLLDRLTKVRFDLSKMKEKDTPDTEKQIKFY
jgi:heme/copper-type cytochrome/quinol oxidase subunit 2